MADAVFVHVGESAGDAGAYPGDGGLRKAHARRPAAAQQHLRMLVSVEREQEEGTAFRLNRCCQHAQKSAPAGWASVRAAPRKSCRGPARVAALQ